MQVTAFKTFLDAGYTISVRAAGGQFYEESLFDTGADDPDAELVAWCESNDAEVVDTIVTNPS